MRVEVRVAHRSQCVSSVLGMERCAHPLVDSMCRNGGLLCSVSVTRSQSSLVRSAVYVAQEGCIASSMLQWFAAHHEKDVVGLVAQALSRESISLGRLRKG